MVALHGCQQTAADFDDETGLVALAEETPFVLLLPEQRAENMPFGCFRWYDPDDNRPGQGESASIRAMIDTAIDRYGVNPDRGFVLGLSAGGAMTAALLANFLIGLPAGRSSPACRSTAIGPRTPSTGFGIG